MSILKDIYLYRYKELDNEICLQNKTIKNVNANSQLSNDIMLNLCALDKLCSDMKQNHQLVHDLHVSL